MKDSYRIVDTDFVPANKRVDRGKFLQAEDVSSVVQGVLEMSARCCPTEIVLEPQVDPEAR